MKKSFNLILIFGFLLFANCLFAQKGTIRGTVIEDATGEPLFGVTVQIKGTTNGAVTDFDGKFEIKVAPGTHDLQASFVSFEPITITNLPVTAGEVYVIDQIRMKEDVEVLEEVVVTAEVVKTTEAALLTVKRKSANLIDGISAASFRKIGDSDAAEAVKRVTGVSVEGGKYVFVRGLGDRYTKTVLNSVDIPGLDPDRNSIQIDIFPTNLIDNMIIKKTATADMPADFTGGVVDIQTKDFPEEKIFDVSVGVTYNPSMHFSDDYLTYNGSDTDWLGFDTDTRALPANARGENIPTPLSGASDEEINDFVGSFNPDLDAFNETSFMDYSLGMTYGDQITLQNEDNLGYFFAVTYKNSRRVYDDQVYGEYQRPSGSDDFELDSAAIQTGVEASNNVLLGGLAGIAYKTELSKYRFTAMHLQNGESKAAEFFINDDPNGEAVGKSQFQGTSDNLEYGQRGLTNFLLNGEHHLNNDKWVIDWKISPTISSLTDPDIRKTAFTLSDAGPTNPPTFNPGAAGNPTRIWRYLDEINLGNRLDITYNYQSFGSDAKLKMGVSYLFKERDYEILQYDLTFFGTQPEWTLDPSPNDVMVPANLYPDGTAYIQTGNANPNPNEYNSTAQNLGIYVSTEFSPLENLKAIVGLRGENFVQRHTGRDILEENVLEDEKVLDAFDLFPSANFILALNDQQNLRVSYSRTIARPSFKELSFAQILDPVSNRTFNGGLFAQGDWDGNLTETRINNIDLRWELFMKRGQLFSVSAFYKTFDDPIELVRIPAAQTTNEFQPRNVGDGTVLGAEFEFRKSLDMISPTLTKFSINANITVVESSIEMTDLEFDARKNFEKDGETIEDTRDMAGQAPYIINGGLAYNNPDIGLEAGMYYNVKGATLVVVGGGLFPDVYSEPFHSLRLNVNKTIGRDQKTTLNFSVSNILNDVREQFYEGFKAQDQFFTRFSPGVAIGFGLNHSF